MNRKFVIALMLALIMPTMLVAANKAHLTYALEDAAYKVATQLNADKRVSSETKNIALARIFVDAGKSVSLSGDDAVVLETALASVPGDLRFVLHSGNDDGWKAIDEIFRQARDMSSWDPKSLPRLKQLKLCDAILVGNVLFYGEQSRGEMSIRLAFRLFKVATAENLWSGVIEGKYSDGGPDNETVSLNWRKALESCAADAVAKLPKSLDGYGLVILPIEGKTGNAMGQVFLNALTAAGKQEQISVYDLPRGNVQDRMFAKFLSERASMSDDDKDMVKRCVGQFATAKKLPSKLAIMTGMVSVVNENPKFELDAYGLPVDFLGGAAAQASQERKSYEVITDFKFRDVNDSFRLIGSIGATGRYAPPVPPPTSYDKLTAELDGLFQFLGMSSTSKAIRIIIAIVVLLCIVGLVKKLIRGASRPR